MVTVDLDVRVCYRKRKDATSRDTCLPFMSEVRGQEIILFTTINHTTDEEVASTRPRFICPT